MLTLLAQTAPSLATAPAPADYGPLPTVLFFVFALLTVGSAFAVAFSRNIVRAAVGLLFALSGMSGLYFLLQAEFLAAVQLVVYVGGTLILMVFGVMLTSKSPSITFAPRRYEVLWGAIVAGVIAIPLMFLFAGVPWALRDESVGGGGPAIEDIGFSFLSARQFLVPFELVSVLLLAVMLGAAYLAKSRKMPPTPSSGSGEGKP